MGFFGSSFRLGRFGCGRSPGDLPPGLPQPPAAKGPYPSFSDPGAAGIYADLTDFDRAQRLKVGNEMASNGWLPDIDAVAFEDTITVNTASELWNWLNGLAYAGVTLDTTRNQKVLLKPSGDYSYANRVQIDRFRGLDWLQNGKMLLIDGQGVTMEQYWTVFGSRGIAIKDINFAHRISDRNAADLLWSPGWQSVTVDNGGSGFSVGEALVTTGTWNSNSYTAPELEVAAVDGNGAITAVTILSRGVFTTSGVSNTFASAGSTGDATLTGTFGANPRDQQVFVIRRTSSFPKFSAVNFYDCEWDAAGRDANPLEWMVALKAQDAEQLGVFGCAFNGAQTAINLLSVRRVIVHDVDVQQQIGDALFCTNTLAANAVGGSSLTSQFGDGTMYVWVSQFTPRNPYDNCELVNAGGHDMGLDLEHSDPVQAGTSGDDAGYELYAENCASYLGRSTSKYRELKDQTLFGGTQAIGYLDDTDHAITAAVFNCFMAGTSPNGGTAWNGDAGYTRSTMVRVGALAASGSGGSGSYNNGPAGVSRKKFGYAGSADHHFEKCVAAEFRTASSGTVYEPGNLTTSACVSADPRVAGDYAAKFPGAFATDGEGRTVYTLDQAAERSAFLAALYAQFGRAAEGFGDPAIWAA